MAPDDAGSMNRTPTIFQPYHPSLPRNKKGEVPVEQNFSLFSSIHAQQARL